MTEEFYVGQRVRLIEDYSTAKAGQLGTISYVTPNPQYPIRVRWDNHFDLYAPGELIFGMDDLGWLMRAGEVEAINEPAN